MYFDIRRLLIAVVVACLMAGCNGSDSDSSSVAPGTPSPVEPTALKRTTLENDAAYIPAQCYTKTVSVSGRVLNSCYTCHTTGFRPDFINDDDLQLEYAFPLFARTNHWDNLFREKRSAVPDAAMTDYIRQSNYFDADGGIILAGQLANVPEAWDYDEDGQWRGYVPDCYFNFDDEGFDRDPSGGYTGWRAFAYYPFPSTHWPTNGSFSDVLIRLPDFFRTVNDQFDIEVYKINLAIVEALIKRRDVVIPAVDESRYGVDLDKDGAFGTATQITYDWAPLAGRYMHYVGDARTINETGGLHLAAGLYPEGTEFLNTLRYIDVTEDGKIVMAPRFKEIRYAQKTKWNTYAELETMAIDEIKDRDDFPDRLELLIGNIEDGISNGVGWRLRGFIEEAGGALRPQTFEETASCIGCHGGIGATTDSTFAFARKLDNTAYRNGWFHWSQKGMEGINEPKTEIERAGVQYEYSFYLMYNGAGDEYRANDDIINAFLDENGFLKQDMAQKLHDDISLLLYPSPERAMMLNKAYKTIVEGQWYIEGRSPMTAATAKVYEEIKPEDEDTKVGEAVVMAAHPDEIGWKRSVPPAGETVGAALQTQVNGNGMGGPNGTEYEIDWQGLIDESSYAPKHLIDAEGGYFPFPPRHTLPVRMVVPLGQIPVCYQCHRISAPVPPQNPQVDTPVDIPATTRSEPGLNLVQLTTDAATDKNAEWRPDGSQIAWVSDRTGENQVWIMNADGSNKVQVTQGPAMHGWPMWKPDGSRLVVWGYDAAANRWSIATVAPDGSDFTVIVESDGPLDRPMWRPDGETIAYAAEGDNWDVWLTTADGSRKWQLTTSPDMETNPLWSPDGSVISYKDAPAAGEYNLTIQNFITFENGFDAPTIHQWDGIKSIQMYDWSPDGAKICYTAEIVTNASGEDRVSYLAVAEDVYPTSEKVSGTPVVLSKGSTLGDRGPVFSPDSARVAFWAWDKAYRATLWIAASDGSGLKQLTTQGFDMYPRWRPDGNALLFESGRAGNMDIWTVDVE